MLELADRAGVDVGEVYRVDASRRTTGINAYVGGLGHTKRVVLYDNLIEDFPADAGAVGGGPRAGHVSTATCPRACSGSRSWRPPGCCCAAAHRGDRGPRDRPARRRPRPGPAIIPALALSLAS